ncbi:MAG: AAA family ATPase [Hyphomicrobiales bacterium]
MKLLKVAVEGVGRFGQRTQVEGLGEGVNVLSAGNEAGKSTLFRAIRLCLFERHRSQNKDIRALATEGLSLPVTIAIAFEKDGIVWEITKSFLKSARASLTRDGVEVARNDAADEEVWRLLGLEAGSGRTLDHAAYGLLWVSQGDSFEAPVLSDKATSALNAAIQQEVGTLVGGERARRVLAEVSATLAENLTDNDKERKGGPFGAARARLAEVDSDRLAARQKLAELHHCIDQLQRLKSELQRDGDPSVTLRLEEEQRLAAAALQSCQTAAKQVKEAEDGEALARQMLDVARDALARAEATARRIDASDQRLQALAGAIAAEESVEAEQCAELSRHQVALRDADAAIQRIDAEARRLERLRRATDAASHRDDLVHRLGSLRAAALTLEKHAGALAANGVTAAVTVELDALLRDQETLEAQIDAAATVATIAVSGAASVTVGGEPITGTLRQAITAPTLIEMNGVTITLTPPARDLAVAHGKRTKLKERLDTLLARHGVTAPAHLRERAAQRRSIEQELAVARANLKGLGCDEHTLPEAVKRYAAQVAQVEALLAEAAVDSGGALPSPAEIEMRLGALASEREDAVRRRAEAEAQVALSGSRLPAIAGKLGQLRGEAKLVSSQRDADILALPPERRQAELTRLAGEVLAREMAHRDRATALSALRHSAPDQAALERAEIAVKRRSEALANHLDRVRRLREDVAGLEGQVQALGGDGLGERVADLDQQHALAEADVNRLSHRVESLKLLRDVVSKAYADRRGQLHAPLRRHLAPFLHDVFPSAELDLAEGFSVAGLKRAGSESFDRLSGGTKEQIAVLVRLAMAAMLAERGFEVPVILDDALVFCDDHRIEQMFDALNRAGRNQQVIVLTCRARSFQSLGGRALRIAS